MLSVPHGTNLPTTTSTSLHDGTYAADVSMVEPVSIIVHCQQTVAAARSLWGREAQTFIDFIDRVGDPQLRHHGAPQQNPYVQVATLPGLNEKLRNQCLHLLYKICKAREMLPTRYLLQQESIHADSLHRCGGFADVSKGEYLDRRVAIKDLRFGTKDGSSRIFKVLNSSNAGYFTTIYFVNSNSVGRS